MSSSQDGNQAPDLNASHAASLKLLALINDVTKVFSDVTDALNQASTGVRINGYPSWE